MQPTPEQLLKAAKTILLVDWPDQSVPRSLVKAGVTVYGFSPDGYSKASISAERSEGKDGVFNPASSEAGYLNFEGIEGNPGAVDIVYIFRPEAEHEDILKNHVLPFGAKAIWLQSPVTSSTIGELAAKQRIQIIEGFNIASIAAKV